MAKAFDSCKLYLLILLFMEKKNVSPRYTHPNDHALTIEKS